jgi:hypothetical protein
MTTNAAELRAQADKLRDEAVALARQSNELGTSNFALSRQLIAQAKAKLDQADAFALQANSSENSGGTASSGQVVAQEQQARSEGATTQNPSDSPFVQSNTGLNVLPEDELEFGTDGRIRPLNETQATPPPPPQPFASPGDEDAAQAPFVTTQTGAGASSDDNPGRSTVSVQQVINANFSKRIDPRPNLLDQYASYTYSLTWYLLTPAQFTAMSVQNKKNISGWQILMQSAGAPITPGNGLPGRNEFFTSDFYMDNLVIEQAIAGKGTGSAQHFATIEFTVTEPNGFTLIENLYRAVSTYYKQNNVGRGLYNNAEYVMCIRFYGYNDFGELVQVGKTTNPGGGSSGVAVSTDVNAVVEKFIPFRISDINTRLVNRVVEYQVKAVGIPYVTAFSSQRGTIPFDYELAGATVGEVLNGRPTGTKYTRTEGRTDTTQPPSGNPTAPGTSVNDISASAGVDANGNFTGESASPFQVGA